MATPKFILGMGNPLLDISAVVDTDFLTKYDVKLDNQILAEEKHMPMFSDLEQNFKADYIPGGATQNTIRVAQWMLGPDDKCTGYMGCTGNDARATKMEEIMSALGCEARYMKDESTPTGTCAVCIVDRERSLIANLAAANNYQISHCKENWDLVEKADICYSAGFFITACAEAMIEVAKHCTSAKKMYAINIAAPFICEVPPFKAALSELLPHVDFLFGNENEARAFATSEGWDTEDIPEIARRASKIASADGKPPRTVIITQGSDATIVAIQGESTAYPVPKMDTSKIIDTNGAGDSFVAGFLSGVAREWDLPDCVRAGNFAAGTIIQHSGCAFPATCDFKLEA